MPVSGLNHPVHQLPLSGEGVELKDFIVVGAGIVIVVGVGIVIVPTA